MNFAVEEVTNDLTARMRISSANHSAFREMIDQHPQNAHRHEHRTSSRCVDSYCTRDHEWVDLPDTKHTRLVDSAGDLVFGPNGEGSNGGHCG